jgi:hypothetical protein
MSSQYENFIQAKLESMNMPRPSDSYNYPVFPGTKEWASLSTGEEMKNACQIPTTVLEKMSTQAVIQAIWEYPLLSEIFNRYQYQRDFEELLSTNNAYMELTKRNDAGKALFDRLLLVNPLTHGATYESQALEILISQTIFLSQLTEEQARKVIEITFKNDDLRQNDVEIMNSLNRSTAWLLIGRTMAVVNYTNFIEVVNGNNQLKYFLDGYIPEPNANLGYVGYTYLEPLYGEIPQLIIDFGNRFLN